MRTPPLVLVIEDSPTQAQHLDVILAARGLNVIIADDGLKGLRLVDERHPDLIVLDVNLPTMDGYQVCKRLKRDPNTAHIPVVMLTTADSASATVQGLDVGADDYIAKDSFATENLLATLDVYWAIPRTGRSMSTMTIRNTGDVERSRNIVRRLIMGQRWSPTFCARAIAAMTTLSELILQSEEGGALDVSVAPQYGNKGVEFRCDVALPSDEGEQLGQARSQLEHVVSELQMHRQTDCIHIIARVWLT